MQCKLCLQDKKLIKKSHIIPNFLYRELFDESKRLVSGHILTGESKTKQSGEWESNILCENCDKTILGTNETYAAKVIFGDRGFKIKAKRFQKDDGLVFDHITGVDYVKFKLFLLSILWRASISSLPMFRQVNLGEKYGERIREMLLTGNPGKVNDFPFMIKTYRQEKLPHQMILEPLKFKIRDHKTGIENHRTSYVFIISGLIISYRIAENESEKWLVEPSIQKNNSLLLIHSPEQQIKSLLQKYFGDIDLSELDF